MTGASQPQQVQSVPVVEADVLDRMNETRELIAQRAYEIYQSRGEGHGSDQDDWFAAEGELLPRLEIDFDISDNAVALTAKVPGFYAKDLEVVIGHHRAVLCGVHSGPKPATSSDRKYRKVMRVIELPFDIDPGAATATFNNGTLRVLLPRLS